MGQMRLLDFNWPRSVLRMPFCEAVKERTTRALLMRGPRVRMGIHAPPLGHGSPDWDDPACGVEMKVRCAPFALCWLYPLWHITNPCARV